MIKSYFKTAWRNLWKHKLFSFINIVGLAAGMVICVIALIDYNKAFNYDKFHPLSNRIYRIITDVTFKQNQQEAYASTPYPVADQLQNNYSFVESTVHVVPEKSTSLQAAGKTLETAACFADASFFKVFGFTLLSGEFTENPNTAVITEETAKRFFGTTGVTGKLLRHKEWGDLLITGIIKSPVEKSHLRFDVITSSSTIAVLEKSGGNIAGINNWVNPWSSYTYVLLKNGSTQHQLNKAIEQIGKLSTAAISADDMQRSISYRSQNLNNINPSHEDLLNFPAGTTYGKLMVEVGIGLLTILLAGFNYVNLTLAKSLTRSREIGVRKVIGAARWQLVCQLVVESICISLLALLLCFILLELLKPMDVINSVFKDARLDGWFYLKLMFFTVCIGFLAGVIPARILSSLKPSLAMKGQKSLTIFKGITIRKTLVVTQFAILLTGIIFMLVMYQQQRFMATADAGFARTNILNIELFGTNAGRLAAEVEKIPGVESVTAASYTLGNNGGRRDKIARPGMDVNTNTELLSADNNFIGVMQLPLVAGANLLPANDTVAGRSVLLNEQAVSKLKFENAHAAVGQTIRLSDSSEVTIAGVVKDFHSMSMVFPVFPLIIRNDPASFSVLQVKTNPAVHSARVKAVVAALWKQLNPYQEFSAEWFDKALYERHFHKSDQLLIVLLCGIVLSIACLGLLGMVTYSSEIRTKEVGVRKVMGAKVSQLLLLLSKEFVLLLVIAGCIAVPAGYVIGNFFLYNFAYHITLGAGTLMGGFLAMLLIGGTTILWQTWRIAIHNPVKSLRAE